MVVKLFKCSLFLLFFQLLITSSVQADGLFYGNSEEAGGTSSSTSSKRDEELFSTPLSISIITAKQIQQAGVTTIAEAMKMVPGVIVREQTNGQFEVHIRGFESVINGATLSNLNSRKTLIMIDNRVVFDYFSGGIFWDTLPISIDDVERIEVVRGAVSSLYGANAVTGVIHIFTKRAQDNSSIKASMMAGTKNSQVAQLVVEKRFSEVDIRFSGLNEKRDRYQNRYFNFTEREYQNSDLAEIESGSNLHNDSEQAVNKHSFMLTLNNDPLNLFNYDLTLFHQESDVQKVHINSGDIPLTDNLSNTDGFNLKLNYGEFSSRFSHHFGKQETMGFPDFTYDTEISQVSMAYQIKYPKWIIQPGVDWYKATYEGSFIGGQRTLLEANYMLRMEFNPKRHWRFISALSYSDFNAPEDNELNYQFMTTYQLSFDTSLRASVQSSSTSAFMVNQYIDIEFTFPNDPSQRIDVKGDKNGRLTRITTYELGFRHQLEFNNFIELEVFQSEMDQFTSFTIQQPVVIDGVTITERSLENLPQNAVQQGLTLNWLYEEKDWNINTFITWQNTEVYNQATSLLHGSATEDNYNKATPKYIAGVNLNWALTSQINLNMLSNYLHEHSFVLQQPQGTKKIPSALYTNLTLNYQHDVAMSGYLAVKNLSDQNESQHFYTDRLEPVYWLGFNIKFGN